MPKRALFVVPFREQNDRSPSSRHSSFPHLPADVSLSSSSQTTFINLKEEENALFTNVKVSNVEVTTEYDRFLGVQVFEISEEILIPLLGTVVQAHQTLP